MTHPFFLFSPSAAPNRSSTLRYFLVSKRTGRFLEQLLRTRMTFEEVSIHLSRSGKPREQFGPLRAIGYGTPDRACRDRR